MKSKSKAVMVMLSIVLIVVASVFSTLAYLTDKEVATNTFTVGKVDIKLEELNWDSEAEHKLVPGAELLKDPTVTVVKGSEESYIRVFVTVSHMKELDAIFARETTLNLIDIFKGYNTTKWTLMEHTIVDEVNNTRTYEFRYYTTVSALEADVSLEPLFTGVVVPGAFTNDDLASLNANGNFTITVKAEAIQALGFADADAAWAAFNTQNQN